MYFNPYAPPKQAFFEEEPLFVTGTFLFVMRSPQSFKNNKIYTQDESSQMVNCYQNQVKQAVSGCCRPFLWGCHRHNFPSSDVCCFTPWGSKSKLYMKKLPKAGSRIVGTYVFRGELLLNVALLYWFFNGDPYNCLSKSLYNWVVYNPLDNLNK